MYISQRFTATKLIISVVLGAFLGRKTPHTQFAPYESPVPARPK